MTTVTRLFRISMTLDECIIRSAYSSYAEICLWHQLLVNTVKCTTGKNSCHVKPTTYLALIIAILCWNFLWHQLLVNTVKCTTGKTVVMWSQLPILPYSMLKFVCKGAREGWIFQLVHTWRSLVAEDEQLYWPSGKSS